MNTHPGPARGFDCGLNSPEPSAVNTAAIAGQQVNGPWQRLKRVRDLVRALIRPAPPRPLRPGWSESLNKAGRPKGRCNLSPACRKVVLALAEEHIRLKALVLHPGTTRIAELAGISERYVPVALKRLVAAGLVELVEVGGGWVPEKHCGRAHMLRLSDLCWGWMAGEDGVASEQAWQMPGEKLRPPPAASPAPPLNENQGEHVASLNKETLEEGVQGKEVSRRVYVVVPPTRPTRRDSPPAKSKPAVRAEIARLSPSARAQYVQEKQAPWDAVLQRMGAVKLPDTPPPLPSHVVEIEEAERKLDRLNDVARGMQQLWDAIGARFVVEES